MHPKGSVAHLTCVCQTAIALACAVSENNAFELAVKAVENGPVFTRALAVARLGLPSVFVLLASPVCVFHHGIAFTFASHVFGLHRRI